MDLVFSRKQSASNLPYFPCIEQNQMKIMSKLTLALLLFATSLTAQSFDYTPSPLNGQVIEYEEFTTCYSNIYEQPLWVAYELTKEELELPSRKRLSKFIQDENVIDGSATHQDYTNTGFDRGHLSRAEYNKRSKESYKESYYTSNISPQIGVNFNRVGGDWYNLEELEKKFSLSLEIIYAVSGPVFKDNIEVIGDKTSIVVPGYFYKAILSKDKKHAIAFLLKHDNIDEASLWDCAITIDQLEGITGLNFFRMLDNKTERTIESELDIEYWKKQSLEH